MRNRSSTLFTGRHFIAAGLILSLGWVRLRVSIEGFFMAGDASKSRLPTFGSLRHTCLLSRWPLNAYDRC